MSQQIKIITPTPKDQQQWQKLYRGYADFYQAPMNDDILQTVWSWIHDENHAFYAIVAKDENENLLGFMHFRAMPSPLRGKMVGFLDDLFVLPEARGKEVAEALFTELKKRGQQQGWPMIRWITAENNYRARNVYDKLSNKTDWKTYQMNI